MNPLSIALSAAIISTVSATNASDIDDPVAVDAFVDGVVIPMMQAHNSPAGTVAIARRGQQVFAKGYGFEDIREAIPVEVDKALFRPGSVSKLFTWVAVMQLVEEGRLDLDEDVNTYLPNFQLDATFDEPVTLRDIMTHTAGFEDGFLGYLIVDDVDVIQPLSETMQQFEPLRVNPPGRQTAYSNYGTALAGYIVEVVDGTPFNDYVKREIFDPLGMARSSFEEPLPGALNDRMAHSYNVGVGGYEEQSFEIIANFAPAGSMSATATDMIRFGQAILNGGGLDGQRILEPATVDKMLTVNFAQDERTSAMLLGFYESHFNGHRVVGHGGDSVFFHSYLGIDRDEELVFFSSFVADGGGVVRSAFAPALYDRFFPEARPAPVAPADFAERAAKYAGTFGFWRSNFSKIEKILGLGSAFEVTPTEANTLLVNAGGAAKHYVEVEPNLFRELDSNFSIGPGMSPAHIAFQENEAGEVTGFVFDDLPFMSTRRLAAYETPDFNLSLVAISLLTMLIVILRRWLQRRELNTMATAERRALQASFYAAFGHWLTVLFGAIVVASAASNLLGGLPTSFKIWLVTPILSTLLTLYLVYRTVGVWRDALFDGVWARVRYTMVATTALSMVWFYYFWNILGFNYLV